MINLILWVVTVAVYFGVWCGLKGNPASTEELLMVLGVFTVLSAPFNIGGDIWTVIGNAKSEKSIFSLFSIYQNAGNDAGAFVAAGYQKAGNYAGAILAGYQKAGNYAVAFVATVYQNAGNDAFALVAGYQNAGNDAIAFVAGYQKAGNDAFALVAAGYQKVGKKERLLAICSELKKE